MVNPFTLGDARTPVRPPAPDEWPPDYEPLRVVGGIVLAVLAGGAFWALVAAVAWVVARALGWWP